MTEVKVNKISPSSGTAFTLGDSGDTFTVPSGATIVNSGTATGFATTVKRHHFTMATRTASSGTSSANVNQLTITSSFIPVDPTAGNNDLWVQCIIPTVNDGNDRSGFGLRFSKSGGSDYDNFGKGVQFVGGIPNNKMDTQSTWFNIAAGTIPAGTYTIYLRTETDSSQPLYYNPNSSDSATIATQTQTELMITEYKN